ncbi:low molecular weight protein-tyrosine-phosphatase [Stappia indica]|uniref:protein-tyrosine-phosphatase n=1 Tax=Stappia indica TaxID=538381 RepID=A0A857C9Z7_9HYPH|nr:low molecular weight protein-tyrosine-phosphatase [Stappia indica]QGZ35322.1 low molecular weight phosphotyrosine protein phosphatase [Stappia indica]
MTAILFVCLGNICRSPLAEGILRHRIRAAGLEHAVSVDSAGTAAWHTGKTPDPRSIAVAARNGIDLTGQRARQVTTADFKTFDIILAMDAANLAELRARAPAGSRAEVRRFLGRDVPDPYYGGPEGFDHVFRMLDEGCVALVAELSERP